MGLSNRILQEAAEGRLLRDDDRRRRDRHPRGVTSLVALLVAMVVLDEFGIWLAQRREKQRTLAEEREDASN